MGRKSRLQLLSESVVGMDPVKALVHVAISNVKHSVVKAAKAKQAQAKYNRSNKGRDKSRRHRTDEKKQRYKAKKNTTDLENHKKNRQQRLESMRQYRSEHRDAINSQIATINKKRRKSDVAYRTACRCRSRIGNFLRSKGTKKTDSTMTLIGCTQKQLMEHLGIENRSEEYHIDHIFPITAYNAANDQSKFMHYTNLQILTAEENISKGSKLPTKDMATKVDMDRWPDGVTYDSLPEKYDNWHSSQKMHIDCTHACQPNQLL
jgi:hypothetical protein